MRKVEEEWNTSKWQRRTREQVNSSYSQFYGCSLSGLYQEAYLC